MNLNVKSIVFNVSEITSYDFPRLKKICQHEAGHIVIAQKHGFQTEGITVSISRSQGHAGSSTIFPWESGITDFDRLERFLERRIQVLYAGAMAEAFDHNQKYDEHYACDEWTKGGAQNDFAKIQQLTQVLRNIKFPETVDEKKAGDELDEIDSNMFNSAHKLVTENLELIERIGDALNRKVEQYDTKYIITEEEIKKLIEQLT